MKVEKLYDRFPLADTLSDKEGGAKVKSTMPMYKGILYERTDDGFGNPIFRKVGENTVVVGGAIESLEHLCNVTANWKPKTINEIDNVEAGHASDNMLSYIALFGVGIGGSGLNFASVVPTDVKSRDVPGRIPFRVTKELTGDDADKYYMREAIVDPDTTEETGDYAYYLKEFAAPIVIKTCWKDSADDEVDGTEVIDEIHESQKTDGLQTFAEFILEFNTKDVREYFEFNGNLISARYNSIGLYMGQKVELDDGREEYVNVRLFSYLNIDNKSVRIKTASQYVYRVLALV